MTVAALRVELEREEAVWGLVNGRRATQRERWATVEPLVREHVPTGTRLRMPLALMPIWYRNRWFDSTQVDGRVELDLCDEFLVHVRALSPTRLEFDVPYSITTPIFLDSVLAGRIGDSS